MAVESCRLSNVDRRDTNGNELIDDDHEEPRFEDEFQFQIAGDDADQNDIDDEEQKEEADIVRIEADSKETLDRPLIKEVSTTSIMSVRQSLSDLLSKASPKGKPFSKN